MNMTQYYEYLTEAGNLRTVAHAERWSRGVLGTLGTVLDRGTKKALSRALPQELSSALGNVFWLLHFPDSNLSADEFQNRVARRSGNSDKVFARFPTLAVFGGIKQMIDSELSERVAKNLSPELRELWQQA